MGRDPGEPTLGEAWQMLAQQMGLTVEERGKRSVRATGSVHGRGFFVDIDGDQRGSEFVRQLSDRRGPSRVHVRWRTEIAVWCANPHRLQGVLASFVDVRDPNWNPRIHLPDHCRKVVTDPPTLAQRLITPSIHQQLMAIWADVRITIEPDAVRLVDEQKSAADSGFVAGSLVHFHPGPIVPWPDRALVGPPWWVLLLAEIATAVDA